MATIGLAGGAGLRTAEIAMMRTSDLFDRDGLVHVVVRDGIRPRTVVMHHGWLSLLTPAREKRNGDEFLIRPQPRSFRSREKAVRTLCNYDAGSPALAKLRDTWVIDQLDRLPLGILTHVAGFSSMLSLVTRYRPFTDEVTDATTAAFGPVMAGVAR